MKPWNRDVDLSSSDFNKMWAAVEARELLFASGISHNTPFVAIVPREYFETRGCMFPEMRIEHLLPSGWSELSAGVYDPGDEVSCGDATKALLDRGFQPSKKFQDFVDASGDSNERKYRGQDRDGCHEQLG